MFLDDFRPWHCKTVVNFTSTKIAQNTVFLDVFDLKYLTRNNNNNNIINNNNNKKNKNKKNMTPCNLGAGGPCHGAAWIQISYIHIAISIYMARIFRCFFRISLHPMRTTGNRPLILGLELQIIQGRLVTRALGLHLSVSSIQWLIGGSYKDFPNRTLSEVWTLYIYTLFFPFCETEAQHNIAYLTGDQNKKDILNRTSLGNKTHAWSTRSHTTTGGGRVPTIHCGEAKHQQRCQDAVAGDENHLDLPEI